MLLKITPFLIILSSFNSLAMDNNKTQENILCPCFGNAINPVIKIIKNMTIRAGASVFKSLLPPVDPASMKACKKIMTESMEFIGRSINYSWSGYDFKIIRPEFQDYCSHHDMHIIRKRLDNQLESLNFEEVYNVMFEQHYGDCFEQASYLALMLKFNKTFDKIFEVFIAHSFFEFKKVLRRHTYLIIVPKDKADIIKNIHEQAFDKLFFVSSFMRDNEMIILDPWQQKQFIIGENFNEREHPLHYLGETFDVRNVLIAINEINAETFSDFFDGFTKFHTALIRSKNH